MTIESIARACHQANRAYCNLIGDFSQPIWEDAPEWQKVSAVKGVRAHLDNPGMSPEDSHRNWMIQKLQEGWKYGTVKNESAKTHPCLLPYELLDDRQKLKDCIFGAIVEALGPFCRPGGSGE